MMNFTLLLLMTVERYLDQQVQFLRSLHSYQRQMMERTLSEMQSTIRTLLQKTLTISLLELQLETETSHQDLQLHLQNQVQLKTLGVKMHRM